MRLRPLWVRGQWQCCYGSFLSIIIVYIYGALHIQMECSVSKCSAALPCSHGRDMESQGIQALSNALAVAIAQHVSPASSQPSSATTQSPTTTPSATPSNSAGNGLAWGGRWGSRRGLGSRARRYTLDAKQDSNLV